MIKHIPNLCAVFQFANAMNLELGHHYDNDTCDDFYEQPYGGCPTEEPAKPHCCTFYQKPDFEGESEDFCIVFASDKE